MEVAGSSELLEVQRKARTDFDSLTPIELERWYAIAGAVFRTWENTYFQYRSGLFDEEEFQAEREVWKLTLATNPGALNYYCSARGIFSEPFSRQMDQLLASPGCTGIEPVTPFAPN
jgi:hypothetical protein